MRINEHYNDLQSSYLFARVGKQVREYRQSHPDAEIISLGIGDVTRPLAPIVVEAMQRAVLEMGHSNTFRGYGEEQGYLFLREAICKYYAQKGVTISPDELFISDGAKSDLGNILDLFDRDNSVLIPEPVYPVYVDTNIMAGRKISYLCATKQSGFLPMPDPDIHADIIYLCSPNNPTGAVYNREQLKIWVDYALKNDAVILFDGAYEAFIQDENLPTSIYQIEGASQCAIEFCSLSKTAGFTGTRCGYTVVPKALIRGGASLRDLWHRRQTTKFNGVPYIVQRGAEAVFTDAGSAQIQQNIDYYRENARIIAEALRALGIHFVGGLNSPYIWLRCPNGLSSWAFFDLLLEKAHVVGTPGSGFGQSGEGYFRLTAFGNREKTIEAMDRIKAIL